MKISEKETEMIIAWKNDGLSGYIVSQRLKEIGIEITKQRVNKIFRL